jgi:hypothetical protein
MPKGFVTTARGEVLNIDALIDAANKPIGLKQEKSEIQPKKVRRAPINVRGFKPAVGEAKAPKIPKEIEKILRTRQDKGYQVVGEEKEDQEEVTLAKITV